MTFLSPWALLIGAVAAAGSVLLHLVALQRPASYLLPTARFIPDRRTLVRRMATRPRDLLLLALRVLLLLSAAAAFARPVLAPSRAPLARVVLFDRSGAVQSMEKAVTQLRPWLTDGVPTQLVLFDSVAVVARDAAAELQALSLASSRTAARDSLRVSSVGSLSAALVAAGRLGPVLAADADSVQLVIVSPLATNEFDAATDSIRAHWRGGIVIARLTSDSVANVARTVSGTLERALSPDDPLAPALRLVRVASSPTSVRLRRSALDARDTAFARSGGTVVRWDSASAAPAGATALAMGDEVVVATLGRGRLLAEGATIARWGDGSAAASEVRIGAGCIRHVAVSVPLAGDLPLRAAFRRVAQGLMAPCSGNRSSRPAADAAVARLRGPEGLASAERLADPAQRPPPLVPWLLGVALACAFGELVVRARVAPERA
ncbi:MAG: hypothetical protein LH467_10055 [Gemmatimonadaceae bacterium]|nr:hypothetical protein [Gemmatimonadaceae bacterium]